MKEYKGFTIPTIDEISSNENITIVPNLLLKSVIGNKRITTPITFEELYKLSTEKQSDEINEYIHNTCCKIIDAYLGGESHD